MACQRPSRQCAGAANDVHARSLVCAGREQTCSDGPRCILVTMTARCLPACTASSCWPLTTLCERPLSCVPTTWLQASIFVRQNAARMVSHEGRLCAFAAEVIGVGADTSIENGTSGSIGPTAGPVPKQSTSKIYLRQNDQSETPAQTGVPPVNNSSGPHTRIGRYVVNGAYLSPWVLGTPRAAKIRPQTPHIAPADPN